MTDSLLMPPPPHAPFIAGSLPGCPLARRLGIVNLFGSCGSESEFHKQIVHSDDSWILLATIAGGGLIKLPACAHKTAASTLLVVPPGCAFRERTLPGADWAWLCLRFKLAPGAPLLNVSIDSPWLGRAEKDLFEMMSDLISCLHAREHRFMARAVARLIETLDATASLIINGPKPELSPFANRACRLMREQPGRNWSVVELARLCNMSVSSFAHSFRKETGVPPVRWLAEERIRVARRLLADNRSIDEIAQALGYSSRYHFTRSFTHMEGIPPGRFQRLATRK